jgi:hypothetical protein
MRQLTTGLVIGFLFGAALAASGYYIDHDRWTWMEPLEKSFYVAGVVDALDAVQVLNEGLGADIVARRIASANQCVASLKLGEVRAIAVSASIKHPELPPAAGLMTELADCSPSPTPQPNPQLGQAPDPAPSPTQTLTP